MCEVECIRIRRQGVERISQQLVEIRFRKVTFVKLFKSFVFVTNMFILISIIFTK